MAEEKYLLSPLGLQLEAMQSGKHKAYTEAIEKAFTCKADRSVTLGETMTLLCCMDNKQGKKCAVGMLYSDDRLAGKSSTEPNLRTELASPVFLDYAMGFHDRGSNFTDDGLSEQGVERLKDLYKLAERFDRNLNYEEE